MMHAPICTCTYRSAPGPGDEVGTEARVLRVVVGKGGDARLVGVAADGAVRRAAGHPHRALLPPPPRNLHVPDLVGVCDREALPRGRVAVVGGEAVDEGDGLARGARALERERHQVGVVHRRDLERVAQLGPAGESGLADRELVLVHVAHNVVGVRRLGDLAEVLAVLPPPDLAHRTCRVVRGTQQRDLSVVVAAVVRVRDRVEAVGGRALGHDEVGAGRGHRQHERNAGEARHHGRTGAVARRRAAGSSERLGDRPRQLRPRGGRRNSATGGEKRRMDSVGTEVPL